MEKSLFVQLKLIFLHLKLVFWIFKGTSIVVYEIEKCGDSCPDKYQKIK